LSAISIPQGTGTEGTVSASQIWWDLSISLYYNDNLYFTDLRWQKRNNQ